MTDLTAPLPAIDDAKVGARALSSRAAGFPLWGLIALALAAAAAVTSSRIVSVWNTGAFFDTDDAMRAVQVRDLLAGQPWFDMTAYRLDPPVGMFSHWSRVVDTPLAGLELFLRLFLSPEYAERATRLVFPFALFAALLRLPPGARRCCGVERRAMRRYGSPFFPAPCIGNSRRDESIITRHRLFCC